MNTKTLLLSTNSSSYNKVMDTVILNDVTVLNISLFDVYEDVLPIGLQINWGDNNILYYDNDLYRIYRKESIIQEVRYGKFSKILLDTYSFEYHPSKTATYKKMTAQFLIKYTNKDTSLITIPIEIRSADYFESVYDMKLISSHILPEDRLKTHKFLTNKDRYMVEVEEPIILEDSNIISDTLFDQDAVEYIKTIESFGVIVTSTQQYAIHTFIKTGKIEGWYPLLKRFYLPIWASVAPNAVDMITRASGTFNGTVTHSSGYVNSDGATGYFDFGVTAASLGLTRASGWMGALMKTAVANHQYLGAQNGAFEAEVLRHTASPLSIVTDYNDGGTGRNSSSSANNGIISASRYGGDMKHFRRATAGRTVAGTYTYPDTGSLTSLNCYALMKNSSGAPTSGSTSQMGAWWLGTGVTDTQDSNMTAALKNLWETATGLTLP